MSRRARRPARSPRQGVWVKRLAALTVPLCLAVLSTVTAAPSALASTSPAVSITSPSSGATVQGTVTVQASGSVDSSQSDQVDYIELYVDGQYADTYDCSSGPDPYSCAASFAWDTTGLSGQHALRVKLSTVNNQSALSPVVSVNVYSRTVVRPQALSVVTSGSTVSVRGYIRATADGRGAGQVPVTVASAPVAGTSQTAHATTDSHGYFAVSFTVRTNTVFEIRTAATTWYGSSAGEAKQLVRARMTCKFSTSHATVGKLDHGSCTVPALPAGVSGHLQSYYEGAWRQIQSVTSGSGRVSWSAMPRRAGTTYLRVTLTANKAYAASTTKPLKRVIKN